MNLQNFHRINFRFSDYISEAFNFYRENFSKIFVASLLMLVMSLIPFCGYLAMGNFFRFMKKLRAGQNPDATQEIFNFDDFVPYFKLMLVLFGAVAVLEVPFFIYMGIFSNDAEAMQSGPPAFLIIYMFVLFIVILYFVSRAFYMSWLISIKRITNLKEAWHISSEMTKNNLLIIIAFSFVISWLSQLGIFACFIGLIFTLPFNYVALYIAMEDGVKQTEGENPSSVQYFK